MRKVFKWLLMPLLGMAIPIASYPSSGLDRRVNESPSPTLDELWYDKHLDIPIQFDPRPRISTTEPGSQQMLPLSGPTPRLLGKSALFRYEIADNAMTFFVFTDKFRWLRIIPWGFLEGCRDKLDRCKTRLTELVFTQMKGYHVNSLGSTIREANQRLPRGETVKILFTLELYPESEEFEWLQSLRNHLSVEFMAIIREEANLIANPQVFRSDSFGTPLIGDSQMERLILRYYPRGTGEDLRADVYKSKNEKSKDDKRENGHAPIMSWPPRGCLTIEA